MNPPDFLFTDHAFSRVVGAAFSTGCKGRMVRVTDEHGPFVATYGTMRGCGDAIRSAEHFVYIDHGYIGRSSNPAAFDGYYRVILDGFWHDCEPTGDDAEAWFAERGLKLAPWREDGRHIVVVPPSDLMTAFHGLEGWRERVVAELRRHTDRPIQFHMKQSPVPLSAALKGAWCVVTDHSNAGIDALVRGIPAIFTNPARPLGSLPEIENPPLRRDFLVRLARSQWTLPQMRSGQCWRELEGQV